MTKYLLIELSTGEVTRLDEWKQPLKQGRPVDHDKMKELVDSVNRAPQYWATTEIAEDLGISYAGALKRIHRAEGYGYIQRTNDNRYWMPGDVKYPEELTHASTSLDVR